MRTVAFALWFLWLASSLTIQAYVFHWPNAPWLIKVLAALASVATVVAGLVTWVWVRRTF